MPSYSAVVSRFATGGLAVACECCEPLPHEAVPTASKPHTTMATIVQTAVLRLALCKNIMPTCVLVIAMSVSRYFLVRFSLLHITTLLVPVAL